MKYKVGDKVKIKSLDWYNENKNKYGNIICGYMPFTSDMSIYCGEVLTICDINEEFSYYHMKKCEYQFTDEMIECKVGEESKLETKFKRGDFVFSGIDSHAMQIINSCYDEHWRYQIFDDVNEYWLFEKELKKVEIGDVVYSEVWKEKVIVREFCDDKFILVVDFNGKLLKSLPSLIKQIKDETKLEPKFKVGDKVKWYNYICNITSIDTNENTYTYLIKHDDYREDKSFAKWVPESEITFEDDEETKPMTYEKTVEIIEAMQGIGDSWECPQGYQFVDENGNVINAQKIELEKANTLKTQSDNMETTSEGKKRCVVYFWDSDFADKVELDLSGGRELIQEDGKWFVVKKKKEYPKTYEECCKVVNANSCIRLVYNLSDGQKYYHDEDNLYLYENFRRLKICRDAYWKIAGEEMGLGKPWEPDYDSGVNKYGIIYMNGVVQESNPTTNWERHLNKVLDFPTSEMRDVFKENFKEEIGICKELL